MTDLAKTIAEDLTARYSKLAAAVREHAEPLSDEQFWTKPFPFGNSYGHLVLHLTGNLNHYIGAHIARTGYVRNRPREFSASDRPLKEQTLKKFDEAVAMVLQTIRAQSAEDWASPYEAEGTEVQNRLDMVLQCATHLHHHIGQMIYLEFELTRKS